VHRINRDSRSSSFDPTRVAELVGRHLQIVRRQRKIKQDVLADALGISRTTASNIERGKQRISIDQLYCAAAVIGVSVADLLPPLEAIQPTKQVFTPTDDPLSASAMDSLLSAIEELSASGKKKVTKRKAGRKPLSRKA
jgi:putative transcriptional regulator